VKTSVFNNSKKNYIKNKNKKLCKNSKKINTKNSTTKRQIQNKFYIFNIKNVVK